MRVQPLQLWNDPMFPSDWVATYVQVTDVLMALIGIYIAYHAYRGYRRNESRPMLYISIGFILVLAVPFVLLMAYHLIPFISETVAVVIQTFQILGLMAILYALRMSG